MLEGCWGVRFLPCHSFRIGVPALEAFSIHSREQTSSGTQHGTFVEGGGCYIQECLSLQYVAQSGVMKFFSHHMCVVPPVTSFPVSWKWPTAVHRTSFFRGFGILGSVTSSATEVKSCQRGPLKPALAGFTLRPPKCRLGQCVPLDVPEWLLVGIGCFGFLERFLFRS